MAGIKYSTHRQRDNKLHRLAMGLALLLGVAGVGLSSYSLLRRQHQDDR